MYWHNWPYAHQILELIPNDVIYLQMLYFLLFISEFMAISCDAFIRLLLQIMFWNQTKTTA